MAAELMITENLLEIENLTKYFRVKGGKTLRAIDGVSLSIRKGETLGLVGESGCGKSTLGRSILRLYEPTQGKIRFNDEPVYDSSVRRQPDIMPFRRKMQIIFQDPSASLNGRMTVREIIREPLEIHGLYPGKQARIERVNELLGLVGLSSEHANRYPHEFSGGQQQRIGIARALAVDPSFIVCDEPISALDVSIQSQIVNMLYDMQSEFGLTYLFIAHDLSVVKHISTRIAVMYLGKIVELSPANELYSNNQHPYTRVLTSAAPIPDPVKARRKLRIIPEGEVPSPINPPSGCRFHPRCMHATLRCSEEEPLLREVAPEHFCACHII